MRGRIKFFILGKLLLAAAIVPAQEAQRSGLLPELLDRAMVFNIAARVVEQDEEIVWDTRDSRVTIPGLPVGIRLVGPNIIVAVQFTPHFRPQGRDLLVAQGQIWLSLPGVGISYHTFMETIPLEFEEEIFFFPLGAEAARDGSSIEILLVIQPYIIPDEILAQEQ